MIVNGKEVHLEAKVFLLDFLKKHNYDLNRIAVEKNGMIVPKKSFDTELICNNDKIEIVNFVGGG
ncbi:MAG: sulfur carrier protein ThiS [Candidatus Cloacimonetes bacterium]|nr:sulfur carrier protein ThiS [Candidatus Cloacimonadota bacterium]